ncbi:hypothetical protein ACSFA2_03885 [Variovorax sp. LT2P21]|uniref:hypothetical protein n=1 Tax=Variovorax sp. LT2P21 TaxID=3443731 RepID=UPI003F4799E0
MSSAKSDGASTLQDTSGPDSPTHRALTSALRQADRARRAEAVRLRQRAALIELMAQTMADLHISMSELGEARRACGSGTQPSASRP